MSNMPLKMRRQRRMHRRRIRFKQLENRLDKKPFPKGRTLRSNDLWKIRERLNLFRFSTLKDYYLSPLWQQTKERMLNGNRPKECESCGSLEDLQLHHRSYKTLCKENLNHVCWLCNHCHEMVHKLVSEGCPLWYATRKVLRRRRGFVTPRKG